MKKVQVLNCMRVSRWCQIRVGRRTGFLCADGQLFACLTASNLVVGIHANAVHGCRVELHYVGLVVGGRDLTGGMFQLPRVYDKDKITRLHYYITPPSRRSGTLCLLACKEDCLQVKSYGFEKPAMHWKLGRSQMYKSKIRQYTRVATSQKSVHIPFIFSQSELIRYIFFWHTNTYLMHAHNVIHPSLKWKQSNAAPDLFLYSMS